MEFKTSTRDYLNILAKSCAWFITFIGFLFILDWNILADFLYLKLPIKGLVLSYFSSISIFAAGILFLNIIYFPRFAFYKFVALIFLVLSTELILEIVLNIDLGVKSYLNQTFSSNFKDLPSVFTGGLFNALLNAIVFLFWPIKNRTSQKSTTISVILSITLLFSVESLFVYVLPINPDEYIAIAQNHLYFAICQIILALGLLFWNGFQDSKAKIKIIKWFGLIFGLSILLFHIFLTSGLFYQQKITQNELIQKQNAAVINELKLNFEEVGGRLTRFATKLELEQKIDAPEVEKDLKSITNEFSFVTKAAVLNASLEEVKSYIRANNYQETNFRNYISQNFKEASSSNKLSAYFETELTRCLLADALTWGNQFQGAIIFDIDFRELFKNIKALSVSSGFVFEIYCKDNLIFKSKVEDNELSSSISQQFVIFDLDFKITSASTSQLLINKMLRSLIYLIMFSGIAGGLVTGFIIYLIQFLREKLRVLESVKDQQEMSNEIMQVMNEAENVPQACEKILKIFNKQYNCQLFVYWQWNNSKKILELVHITSIPEGAFANFEIALRSGIKTLAHEAFEKKEVLFCEDISLKHDAISEAAKKEGLKGEFDLPVYQKRNVLGVVQLVKKEIFDLEPEPDWIALMEILGNQFNVFIERREAHIKDKELAVLLTNSSDAIYKSDLNLKIIEWNLGAERIYGYAAHEIIGKTVYELYPKERINEAKNIIDSLILGKSIEHFKTVRLSKSGDLIHVENSYAPIKNEKGETISYITVSRDVTSETNILAKIEFNEEKFRLFVEATQSWLWEMNLDGYFTYSNPAVSTILGYSIDEVLKLNWRSLVVEKQKLEKEISDSKFDLLTWKNKLIQSISKNGTLIWLEMTVDAIYDKNHKKIGFRGVCRDVTEQIQVNRSKDEFVSMVSHELRSPLTSIKGALALLHPKILKDQESDELYQLAERNTERLLNLVNDILDIQKLSLGKLVVSLKTQELSKVIDEAVKISSSLAEAQNISLVLENNYKNIFVDIDYDRFIQIISNLLTNAIKFSPKGSQVTIFTEKNGNAIRIAIKDKGPGIAYDLQGKLFEKFVQGDAGDTKMKGTGLGLSISKALIEQMGGSIGFTSQPQYGSTFYIDLPIVKHEL